MTRGHLRDHSRMHTNDRPYICKICSQGFMRSSTLKVHSRIHSGERPYICPFPGCGKTFTESGNLNTHKKLHNPEKVPRIAKEKKVKPGKKGKKREEPEKARKEQANPAGMSAFTPYKADAAIPSFPNNPLPVQQPQPQCLASPQHHPPSQPQTAVPQPPPIKLEPLKLKIPFSDAEPILSPQNCGSPPCITPSNIAVSRVPTPMAGYYPASAISPNPLIRLSPANCQNMVYQVPYGVSGLSPVHGFYPLCSPMNNIASNGYSDFSAAFNDRNKTMSTMSQPGVVGVSPMPQLMYSPGMESFSPIHFTGYGFKK